MISYPSPNYDVRQDSIRFLIMHYTATTTAQEALDILTCPKRNVSCHYLIDTDGTLYNLVDDTKRAYHAGVSFWQGTENLNHSSLGIELVNLGCTPFPEAQINALIALSKELMEKWHILPYNVLGHSDIAPNRKNDPGPLFPWEELSKHGIGFFPEIIDNDGPLPPKAEALALQMLHEIGYMKTDEATLFKTFCAHFYSKGFNKPFDAKLFWRITQINKNYIKF